MADVWATDGGIYFGVGSKSTEGPPPVPGAGAPLFYVGDRHIVTLGPNAREIAANAVAERSQSCRLVDAGDRSKGELARIP